MYTSFSPDMPTRQLLELDEALQDNDVSYITAEISNLDSDYAYAYRARLTPAPRVMVLIETRTIRQGNRESWYRKIKNIIDSNTDLEYFDTISKVFTTRSTSTLIAQHKHAKTYIIAVSRLNSDDFYYYFLAAMLLDYKTNEDFVRRASTAIQNKEYLVLNADELNRIELSKSKKTRKDFLRVSEKILRLPSKEEKIKYKQSKLRDLVREYGMMQAELKELIMYEHARTFEQDSFEDSIEELEGYIISNTERILDMLVASDSRIYLTLQSYLSIPTSAEDYFKESSMSNHRHALYEEPYLQRLFIDVMEQKVRLPILAHYVLTVTQSATDTRIQGVQDFKLESQIPYDRRKFARNMHIIQHNCFEGYRRQMYDMIYDQDMIGLFEVMFQCTGAVNVFDPYVFPGVVTSVKRMHVNTEIQYKEEDQWETIKLGGYYEKIKDR